MENEERLQRIKGEAQDIQESAVPSAVMWSAYLETHQFITNFGFFFTAGAFLASVAGISAIVGFSATLSAAKKADPKYFNKGLHSSADLADAGAILALRALGWGTIYAVAGTSCLCYGIYKLSGAKNLKDFRIKMGNLLPALPKNSPPTSRTEFSGLNDLMTYLAEDYGKKKEK